MAKYRTIRIDFKAYGDKHLNVVMLSVTCNLTRAFLLNYPEIPDRKQSMPFNNINI